MTNEEIDALPAGREMDTLVAEKVIGFVSNFQDGLVWRTVNGRLLHHWSPSTDIATAWEVVEKLMEDSDVFIEYWNDSEWFVASHPLGYSSREPMAHCDGKKTGKPSIALAICRWALKKVQHG